MKNIYVITTGFFIPKIIVASFEATFHQAYFWNTKPHILYFDHILLPLKCIFSHFHMTDVLRPLTSHSKSARWLKSLYSTYFYKWKYIATKVFFAISFAIATEHGFFSKKKLHWAILHFLDFLFNIYHKNPKTDINLHSRRVFLRPTYFFQKKDSRRFWIKIFFFKLLKC